MVMVNMTGAKVKVGLKQNIPQCIMTINNNTLNYLQSLSSPGVRSDADETVEGVLQVDLCKDRDTV